jgi:hypothetical protein
MLFVKEEHLALIGVKIPDLNPDSRCLHAEIKQK